MAEIKETKPEDVHPKEETEEDTCTAHFEPVIKLPAVETATLEENEEEMFVMRSKLFRFDSSAEPPEWKERGTGDIKLLRHKKSGLIRLLMRRDKTLKICANHYVSPLMELKPNCGSERAWVWSTSADFADEEPKAELLAIRFANAENAQKFKAKFEECQKIMKEKLKYEEDGEDTQESRDSPVKKINRDTKAPINDKKEKDTEQIAEKLGDLSVKDDTNCVGNNSDSKESKEA